MNVRKITMSRSGRGALGAAALASAPPLADAPSVRQRMRRAFPLVDGVTYAIAAGVLTVVWVGTDLLERLAVHLGLLP